MLEYGFKVDPQRAQTEARAYIARNPNARKVRLMLAGQLADSGDYNAALAELQAMSRRSPEDFDLLFMQAQLAYKAGQLQQARTLLQQYLDVQNQRQRATVPGATDAGAAAADAHVLLSRIAEDQGRYDEAINELGRIEDPTLRYSVRMRAALRAKEGRVDDALSMIDAAGPQDEEERTQGVLTKAQILRDADRVGQAVAVLEAADRDLPDTVEIKYELAMLYERQDRVADLERLLRQVIALDPDHAHAYNALGYTLADRNQRLPEALDLITQALELAPNDPFILDSMGWVKFRMGDQAAAAEYLRRAYSTRPEADIAAHLAEVLWSQGKRDQAVELLRGAKLKDPTNRALLDTIKRLGSRFDHGCHAPMARRVGVAARGLDGHAGVHAGGLHHHAQAHRGHRARRVSRIGRFAITVNEESGKQNAVQGGFSWSDDGRRYVLDLTNPLGSTEARVEGQPGSASLTKADGTRLVADNPDALAEDALGSSMPVAGLRDWLRGKLPAEPEPGELSRDELGRPAGFEQGGWRVRLSRYDTKGPMLLVMERQEPGRRILVRLVVNQP